MSLHLGNLSPYIGRDELGRVFGRFGQCNVRLKDGFGFVVYDFPPNADTALKALRGKNICGEPITLHWSKKQPRPTQGVTRGSRTYVNQRGRSSVRGENYFHRKWGSNDQQDQKMGLRQSANDDDDDRQNSVEKVNEIISPPQNADKNDAGEDLDIMEGQLTLEAHDEQSDTVDVDRWIEQVDGPLDGTEAEAEGELVFDRYEPYQNIDRIDEVLTHKENHSGSSTPPHHSDIKLKQAPTALKYEHIGYASRNLGHKMLDYPQDHPFPRKKSSIFDRSRDYDNRFRDMSKGDNARTHGSTSHRTQQLSRDVDLHSRMTSESTITGLRDHRRLAMRKNSPVKKDQHDKKQGCSEDRISERKRFKETLPLVSSPVCSSFSASRSQSRLMSSKSVTHSVSSLSRSVSPRKHSPYSKSVSSDPRSGSIHGPRTSLSLSASLGQPLSSSPNIVMHGHDTSLVNVTPETRDDMVESVKGIEGDSLADISTVERATIVLHNKLPYTVTYAAEGKEESGSAYVNGDHSTPTKNLNSEAVLVETAPAVPLKANDEISVNGDDKTIDISAEEFYMVLRHYGLQHSAGTDKKLSIESHFGSARQWPWEVIYYRRLRKGPISYENYAKRIAQNKEFNIVDKYVRSSSGWGEVGSLFS